MVPPIFRSRTSYFAAIFNATVKIGEMEAGRPCFRGWSERGNERAVRRLVQAGALPVHKSTPSHHASSSLSSSSASERVVVRWCRWRARRARSSHQKGMEGRSASVRGCDSTASTRLGAQKEGI